MRALFVVLLLTGCTTVSGGGRADALAPGAVEAGGSLALGLHAAKRAPGRPVPLPSYVLGAGVRAGVMSGVDVGLRAWGGAVPGMSNAGALIDGKLQFVDSHAFDASTSIGLSLARFGVGGADSVSLGMPVRLAGGWNMGGDNQLFFGPAFAAEVFWSASAQPVTIGWSGAFIGVAWKLGRQFELRPELSVRYSPVKFNGLVENKERQGLTQVELTLGGAFSL